MACGFVAAGVVAQVTASKSVITVGASQPWRVPLFRLQMKVAPASRPIWPPCWVITASVSAAACAPRAVRLT